MAPLDLAPLAGTVRHALLFAGIGFSFGVVLEMAGFGDTRKLAGQFYFRDLTVLRVMFTAIVVAMVLIGLASAFGVLDMSRVWVNPTYLWPAIAGGLLMGVGFVLGGFCPGTSLVAAATFKIDGMFFVAGALLGVFAFGESVGSFEPFFLSSAMGRFTLPEWLGLPLGVVVLLIVIMALALFRGADVLERRFGDPTLRAPRLGRGFERVGAGALVLAGLVLAVRGEPSLEARWERVAPGLQKQLADRAMFVSPAEVVSLRKDTSLQVSIIDVREEHDYNLFHVAGARRVARRDLESEGSLHALLERPDTAVTFLMSNGEEASFAAWKALRAAGVNNLYVVEGGVNRWLDLYPAPDCVAEPAPTSGADALARRFFFATGSRLPAAAPELPASREPVLPCGPRRVHHAGAEHATGFPDHPFVKRVVRQSRAVVKGGCG